MPLINFVTVHLKDQWPMSIFYDKSGSHKSQITHWETADRQWHGSWVQVTHGSGTGYDSPTCELSNEPKNIFFGPKLKELWVIS